MLGRNIIALFCEDIREEKGEMTTLLGIFPDNINVVAPDDKPISDDKRPVIPKLCVYVRFNFPIEFDFPECEARLIMADGHIFELGSIQKNLVESAKKNAAEKKTALAGITLKATLANLPLKQPGLMRVEIHTGAEIEVVGGVNFQYELPKITPTASEPPSVQ